MNVKLYTFKDTDYKEVNGRYHTPANLLQQEEPQCQWKECTFFKYDRTFNKYDFTATYLLMELSPS
jgi:hypothetical protein